MLHTPRPKHLALRAVEPADIDFMYRCENEPDIYTQGILLAPISRHALLQLVNNSFLSISESGQVRLIATLLPTQTPIGLVDLFDINLINRTAAVGIAVYPTEQRGKGHAKQALLLLEEYAAQRLNIRTLYAEIRASNTPSLHLFSQANYHRIGTKRLWLRSINSNSWDDVECFQKFIEL